MSLLVDTHGTGQVTKSKLEKVLPELFRLRRPTSGASCKLNRPIYRRTAAYGHFGRAPEAMAASPGKQVDIADAIKRAVS